MGTYLVTGIVHKILARKRDIERGNLSIENIE